ncbi:hypothetical protein P154DRAFT_402778, partial [Amniculicola lignicola CBS 123094]
MGFFSRKPPEPQGPVPKIQMHIHSIKDAVFKPNDIISGHITIITPFPITPQAIEVSLWGLSETWIRTSHHHRGAGDTTKTDYHHYRDHAPLFTVTVNVFADSATKSLQPGEPYSFPFTFRMPEGTSNNRSECYKDPIRVPFTVTPHHLPPSF